MTLFTELQVRHTQTRHNQPLAELLNLPGNGTEMTPAQMRALATALMTAADDCEQRAMDKKHFMKTIKLYPLSPVNCSN